jgi:hypothetical protein
MSTNQGYNGWTNYETWNWALWLDNEQGTQEYWREQAAEAYRNADKGEDRIHDAACELLELMKSECEENTPEVTGPYADLLNAAIGEINFYEIAENYVKEAASEVDAEEAAEASDE